MKYSALCTLLETQSCAIVAEQFRITKHWHNGVSLGLAKQQTVAPCADMCEWIAVCVYIIHVHVHMHSQLDGEAGDPVARQASTTTAHA